FEDADIAFRMRGLGYEVWLQPLSLVIHYEGRTHGRDLTAGTKAHQIVNQEKFYHRWRDVLWAHSIMGGSPMSESDRSKRQRILIVDAQTPMVDRDAGSIITYETIRLFIELGWHVSFVPRDFAQVAPYTASLQKIGVEVLTEPFITDLKDILQT